MAFPYITREPEMDLGRAVQNEHLGSNFVIDNESHFFVDA